MAYLGIFFVIFGIWQSFMNGQYSSRIAGTSFLLGFIILLIKWWQALLIIIVAFILFFLIGQLIGSDKKKIKNIKKAYLQAKEEYPDINEDKICREIFINRLLATKLTSKMKNEQEARSYINEVHIEPFNLNSLCEAIISFENPSKYMVTNFKNEYKDIKKWQKNKEDLRKLIDNIIKS